MSTQTRVRLGDRLIAKNLISKQQLDVALSEQRRAYRPLGEILISLGFVRAEEVARLLAEDLGLPFVQAAEITPDPALLAAIDREFVRNAKAFPINVVEGSLRIAMVHPDDPEKVAAVRARFPFPLELCVTTDKELELLLRAYVAVSGNRVARLLEAQPEEGPGYEKDWPIEKITQALFADGLLRGATDIHVEPEEKLTRVRYRIDGILMQGENLPREATDAVISRIKVLSNLDISERRRPQDGRMRVTFEERHVEVRVSILPTVDGENVVLRILDRAGGAISIAELGIEDRQQRLLTKIAERPHGLFVVSGPTGSGKTTTLYSLLSQIDAMQRNVATIEDPIEYRLPLLRQSQVDAAIGYGFKEGLRSLLRQDPDVILVGEVRDPETAEMAIKASMTGHLVFTTLHTNSALGAIPRLVDLGVDSYLIEDALLGVLAQRLVRKNCPACSSYQDLNASEREWLGPDAVQIKRGRGCSRCRQSGFSGRIAITELFLPTEVMGDILRAGSELNKLRELARGAGFRTMEDDGREKVRAGLTTMAEVMRVNQSSRVTEDEV